MADDEAQRNEVELRENGDVVASFRDVVMDGGHGLECVPLFIKKILATGAWRERIERGKMLANDSFLAFITDKPMKGCAFKPEQVEALIKHDPETLAMWREAVKAGQGTRTDLHDNIIEVKVDQGTSLSYTLSRLKRDHPELFAAVVAERMSANAAAIEAGFRKKQTPFEQVMRLIPKLTDEEWELVRGARQ